MQSLRSRLFNFVLRHRHLLRGKLRPQIFTMESSIPAFRADCEQSAARLSRPPKGVAITPRTLAGITCERITPTGAPPDKLILYCHGGGYVSGSTDDHRGFVAAFARRVGYAALTYNYRLAPEFPFPAAVDDSVAVYEALLEEHAPANLLLAGESAGGGLCLALLLALRKRGLPLPAAAVAISPWTDLSCSSASYHERNARSVAPLNSWTVFSHHYAGTTDRHEPLLSPLFGDLAGLPPLFINSAADDELFEDGKRFAQRAREAGVQAQFRAGHGMVHCYPLMSPLFPEAKFAMDEIVDFVRRHLR